MYRILLIFVSCLIVTGVLSGCADQQRTTQNTQKKDPVTHTVQNQSLLLQDTETINIASIESDGGIADKENHLGYCLIKFPGKVDINSPHFIPYVIEMKNEKAGFMPEEPRISDTGSNPYPLNSKYYFENTARDKDFIVYVKVPITDNEAKELYNEPIMILPSIRDRALTILDNTSITVSDSSGNSKSYLLTKE